MALRASVEVEAGVAVVRQTADAVDAGRLRRRAEGLTATAGPGVVPVVRSGATDHGGWELVTVHAGLPLDAARLEGPAALASIGARVAATLARLHDQGLAHGRLEVEHIVVSRDGAPLLCGIDPGDADPADDVAALGRALGLVAAELAPATGTGRESLLALNVLAALATSDEPERRPTARRLSSDLVAIAGPAAPGATAPGGGRRPITRSEPRAASRLVALGGAAFAIALALAVGLAARGGGAAPRAAARGITSSTADSAASITTTTTAEAPPDCVATADRAVVPDDGCPSSIAIEGGVVVLDGVRIVVGRAEDEIVVADWGCDGALRPAVLRPSTGEVLVYAPLVAGQSPAVAQAERILGARGVSARRGPEGCAELLIDTDDGPIRLT
jgi:hypothetical protein